MCQAPTPAAGAATQRKPGQVVLALWVSLIHGITDSRSPPPHHPRLTGRAQVRRSVLGEDADRRALRNRTLERGAVFADLLDGPDGALAVAAGGAAECVGSSSRRA